MNSKKPQTNLTAILWAVAVGELLAAAVSMAVAPDLVWLTAIFVVALVGTLGYLAYVNRGALRGRAAVFGVNSAMVTALVIGIVGVLNFLVNKHPLKGDLTRNKIHTLSDQTAKTLKGLKIPPKFVFYSKLQQRDEFRTLFDNYRALNPKLEIEYVDPDKEPVRAKTAGVKKYGTLVVSIGSKENKIEDLSEEKITNSVIKLAKDRPQILCWITGHGEKDMGGSDAEGYSTAKKGLLDQAYEVIAVNLPQETKIPENCDAIALIGPGKAFFAPEVKVIEDYLAAGGRALVALDFDVQTGGDRAAELHRILEKWHVKADSALVVDPLSRMLGVNAAVPILATFQKEHAITKDFQGNCYFPFARPIEIVKGAPPELKVQWLGQTTPKSWGEFDMKELATGRVQMSEGKDKVGPITVAVAVEGKQKDSKASKNARIVVFGTSQFATNNYSRFGGNLDFFLNAASWALEDESMISIRANEEGPGRIELSRASGNFIFFLTVIIIPVLTAGGGVGIWYYRRKL